MKNEHKTYSKIYSELLERMNDMEEYIDLYNDNGENLGIVISREKEKEMLEGQHVLISAIIVKNSENKVMMQLTSKTKGSVLALPSGHVLHNEDSKDAIVREMFEEQGLVIDKEKVRLIEKRLGSKTSFYHIYYLEADYKKENMVLQESEVADVFWMTPEEIFEAYDEGKVRKTSMDSVRNFLRSRADKNE